MILRDHEATFGDRRFRLTLALTDDLADDLPVSAAHCLGFGDGATFLLTRHVTRHWTIPGGRCDPGETAEETMRRETLEEAAATVADPVVVATERIELLEGEPDPQFQSPMFQVFFVARVVSLAPVTPNEETLDSRLFTIAEARTLPGWLDHNAPLFDAACAVARRRWSE